MASPFPGMDPYLENTTLWRGVQTWLITAIAELLQPLLVVRGYFVSVESRVWMEDVERPIYPDVIVLKSSRPPIPILGAPASATSATLIADPPVRLRVREMEVEEKFLEVRQIGTRTLVSGIEVISPGNKIHPKVRKLYLRKRRELHSAGINLVEIDLLRDGKPLVRLPQIALDTRGKDDYVVNIVRAGSGDYEYYPIALRQRLPRIGVPLKMGEPDVVLDLQAALVRVYEMGAYAIQIDYQESPKPGLSRENTEWSNALLIAGGLRTTTP